MLHCRCCLQSQEPAEQGRRMHRSLLQLQQLCQYRIVMSAGCSMHAYSPNLQKVVSYTPLFDAVLGINGFLALVFAVVHCCMAEEVGALGLPQPCYHGGVGAGLLCASGILPVMHRLQHAACPLHLTPCCLPPWSALQCVKFCTYQIQSFLTFNIY